MFVLLRRYTLLCCPCGRLLGHRYCDQQAAVREVPPPTLLPIQLAASRHQGLEPARV